MQISKQEYFDRLFNTDSYDVDDMFSLREKYFGREETAVVDEDNEPDRSEALNEYDEFLKMYWKLSSEERSKKMAQLNKSLEPFPDLHKRIKDLKDLEGDLEQIRAMKEENKMDSTFIDTVLDILILPSNQQAINKTRYVNHYVAGKKNSRLIRTAKIIKKRLPNIYRENKSFFDKIINFRTTKKLEAEKNMTFDWATLGWGLVFVIWGLTKCL